MRGNSKISNGYQIVNRQHALPAVGQRNWSIVQDRADMVELHVIGIPNSRPASVLDVGIDKGRPYSRVRRDGTRIDDVEDSLSKIESAVGPVWSSIEDLWPLTIEHKALLAEFFAAQAVRGRAWREQRKELIAAALDGHNFDSVTDDEVKFVLETQKLKTTLLDNTQTNMDMLSTMKKVHAGFLSMHWTLLKFERPVIAFSDHPIVVRSLTGKAVEPPKTPQLGILQSLEIYAPISPHYVILMTWIWKRDTVEPVPGKLAYARTINEFVIAQAQKQWIHKIGTNPLRGRGKRRPIAPSIHTGYNTRYAARSLLRSEVSKLLLGMGQGAFMRRYTDNEITYTRAQPSVD